jgi:aryl sulfotransferase
VPNAPIHYASPDEDSSRWIDFPFRAGDIVISTRSKTGTTWVQMICALLVFQTPELPDPLSKLSPWLDWLIAPRADVYDQLAAQEHRRFIKTHTPLDGLPIDSRVTYVVTGRHPLDTAVSLYHHRGNLDRERIHELAGRPGSEPAADHSPPLHQWLLEWIEQDVEPRDSLDSLPGVMWHLTDAWGRRATQDVVLVHYDDLVHDLDAEMRRLAGRLAVAVPEERWPALVEAATFAQMRERATSIAPDPSGVLRDRTAFFRRGSSGAGAEALRHSELDRYYRRASTLAPPDVLEWLHHGA